jgi:hypothetical protein
VAPGGDAAIQALANGLEDRGDPRAAALRNLTGLETVIQETSPGMYLAEYRRDGKRCDYTLLWLRPSEGTEEARMQRVQELLRNRQTEKVWQRLGLSQDESNTLRQYFGLGPRGPISARQSLKAQKLRESGIQAPPPGDAPPGGMSIQEIAWREGRHVQTIRIRIYQAQYHLSVPRPDSGAAGLCPLPG